MVSSSTPANLWVLLGLGLAGILIITRKMKKKIMREDFGAFVAKLQLLPPPQPAPPKAPHPLTSLSFVISDIFDIEGHVTGFGHPDWASLHDPASQTSAAVAALVEGGATCVGKTVIDELGYSTSGENKHYGTPTNPAAPARIPGGSSSGAAVAVAANLADFGLGVDSVGGVRVPAGYCGILGFRSSYGAVSDSGILKVSSSLDTVGWFAKNPSVLRRVGHVILQLPFGAQRNPRQIFVADDCFQLQKFPPDFLPQLFIRSAENVYGRQAIKHIMLFEYLISRVPSMKKFIDELSNGGCKNSELNSLAVAVNSIQKSEFSALHGSFINSESTNLGSAISSELNEMIDLPDLDKISESLRSEMREAMNALLKDDGVLVFPTTGFLPPKLGGKEISSNEYKVTSSGLLSIASLSGCCQAVMPVGHFEKSPLSVSLVARHGGDRFLLDTVQAIFPSLQEQANSFTDSKLPRNAESKENSAEIAKEKGNQAFKEKQWQKAVGYYTEAIKLNANVATYYSNRAAAYLEIGSFLQAESDCTTAIEFDRKNVKAYLRRGTAREMLGFYKEASDDFKYALVLEPTNKRAALSAERLRKVVM